MSASAGTPTSAPKAMSSRLLTMKFMQRAAASSPTNTSPSPLDEPSPKRQKTAHNTPTKFNVDTLTNNRAIQAAIEEEEAKKQAALDRAATEAGDTRWVLSFEDRKHFNTPTNTLRVVQAGFAILDLPSPKLVHSGGDDDVFGDEKPVMVGRRSFGKFNRVLEKQQNPDMDDSSSSDEEESESEESAEDSEDDPTGTNELIKASREEATKRAREERKAKKKAEKAELLELSKKRKKKHVSLNGLTSLSGSGGGGAASKPSIECYSCGGNHIARECPKQKRKYQGDDGGARKKAQRTR